MLIIFELRSAAQHPCAQTVANNSSNNSTHSDSTHVAYEVTSDYIGAVNTVVAVVVEALVLAPLYSLASGAVTYGLCQKKSEANVFLLTRHNTGLGMVSP